MKWWWSSGQLARLPSIRVRIPLSLQFKFCKFFEKNENKQKEAGVGPFYLKNFIVLNQRSSRGNRLGRSFPSTSFEVKISLVRRDKPLRKYFEIPSKKFCSFTLVQDSRFSRSKLSPGSRERFLPLEVSAKMDKEKWERKAKREERLFRGIQQAPTNIRRQSYAKTWGIFCWSK